jgi:hypothetical protein
MFSLHLNSPFAAPGQAIFGETISRFHRLQTWKHNLDAPFSGSRMRALPPPTASQAKPIITKVPDAATALLSTPAND